jgi:hypothetical protein
MKKLATLLFFLIIATSVHQVWADEVDSTTHLKYTVSGGEVTVTGFDDEFTPPADYALVIPNEIASMPVVAIGDQAFLDQTTISSITIGDNVRSIGTDAVRRCTSLTSIIFSSETNLTTIGESAFRGCQATSIVIPEGVTTLGNWAIGVCSLLESVTLPSTLTTIGSGTFNYNPKLNNVSVPASVTSISEYAFDNCTGLTSITIPNGPTSIGQYAFRNCNQLTSITIPSSVLSVGNYAFYLCSGLTEITIPNGVTTLGNYVFRECTSLEEATIPGSVTSVGTKIFEGCSAIRSLNLNCRNIPDNCASYKTTLESVVIGANVRTIGTAAFRGCSALASVTFAPAGSLTTIGDQAFMDDTSLTGITIPNTVTSMGTKIFWACTALATVTFEDGFSMTYLPTSMFQACSTLTSVSIPSGITSVGESVFYDCTSLPSITIPASVTSIGAHAFRNCSLLASVTFEDGCHITSIPNYCFDYCIVLGNVSIPSTVTSIGSYAFDNCRAFTSVSLPSGVTSIGEYAFRNCNQLTSFTIPSGVTSIGQMALSYLTGITSIEIPSSVKTVGQSVFKGCSNLTTVTFAAGSKLTALSQYMFEICTSLETITIPSSVTTIGYQPFKGCTAFRSIVIPRTVTHLDETYTFYGLTALESVTFEEPCQITTFPNSTFSGCTSLASFTVPSSITTIGPYAFQGCTSLTSFSIPSTVKAVEHRSFLDCSSLANLTIANGVESIGDLAFQGTALTSVTVPNSVSSLGNDLFNGCSSLMMIDMSRTERVAALYGLTTINRTSAGIFNGIPAACEVILPPYCRATGDHVTVSDPPAEGALTTAADGYYELYTANHWRLFSYIALGRNGYANARMMADIDLGDDQSRIGTNSTANSGWFRGVFDGQGHTLTVAYVEPGENECAPFNKINGATIRNLKVTGTINLTGYGYHTAGIASASWGTSTIEHCWSDITIGSNGDGGEAGAIVGCHKGGTLTITDCLFTGSIAGSGGWNGCFVGYSDSGTLTQTNCLSTGTFSYPSSNRNFRGTHVNCYVKQYPVALVDGITRATDENLADGTVATALQAGRGDIVWVQDPDLNTPMLKLFASPFPPVNISATSATFWGEDKYVTTFYSAASAYQLPSGAKAYTAALDGESVVFYRIGTDGRVIPAGTAAIIVADDSNLELAGVYTAVTAKAGNILQGSAIDVAVTAGKVDDKTPYVLGVNGGVLGLYKFTGSSIPAGKAYYLKSE